MAKFLRRQQSRRLVARFHGSVLLSSETCLSFALVIFAEQVPVYLRAAFAGRFLAPSLEPSVDVDGSVGIFVVDRICESLPG